MATIPYTIEEIDARISAVRENLRELVEQAAGYSGAADDELVSQRIAEQEAQLEMLIRVRRSVGEEEPRDSRDARPRSRR